MNIEKWYGQDIYKNWHCKFPFEKLPSYNTFLEIMDPEVRIKQLADRVNLKGVRILELGCLEGAHSLMLQGLGAGEVIAIEGREESFLKCLILKNAFKLDNCQFLHGDITEILPIISGSFDICLALGVLYHLRNPACAIYRIAELADKLFAWTHFATKDYPEGKIAEIEYAGHVYRGKYVGEETDSYLAALEKESFLLLEEDVFNLVSDSGFRNIELIGKENNQHKPAMTFLASK